MTPDELHAAFWWGLGAFGVMSGLAAYALRRAAGDLADDAEEAYGYGWGDGTQGGA